MKPCSPSRVRSHFRNCGSWTRSSSSSVAGRGSIDVKDSSDRSLAARAASQLGLDGLGAERCLATRANGAATRAALGKATPDARGDAARQLCDQIASAAAGALGGKPCIVAVVDNAGKIVGRNGSDLN